MPCILLVDNHTLYRNALRGGLESRMGKVRVLEVDNLAAAQAHFEPDGTLDLVLVDLTMPAVASLEMLRPVHERYPKTRFAAMSALATRLDILRCLEIGLYGLISKSQSDDEILSAIRDILSDRVYVPVLLTHVDEIATQVSGTNGYAPAPTPVRMDARVDRHSHVGQLTRRQREVLPLLARGMSNKEIARALKIAEGTTKIHASSLLRVLGARNRTEAAVIAQSYLLNVEHRASFGTTLAASPRSRRR
jgi:DNA-binding NarL/FixJ family response regulator